MHVGSPNIISAAVGQAQNLYKHILANTLQKHCFCQCNRVHVSTYLSRNFAKTQFLQRQLCASSQKLGWENKFKNVLGLEGYEFGFVS